ncbi:hypothetical protein [Baekduia sp. Peel2402]|uniref:hypothetical protein n=1 Tax=Baekduia sp. Peel2402 TaxID=3458296 RepID=UPI00403EBC64
MTRTLAPALFSATSVSAAGRRRAASDLRLYRVDLVDRAGDANAEQRAPGIGVKGD